MAAAWLSSRISSMDLMQRASSIDCCASTTRRPWRSISKRNGGSTMSMPTGMSATPASSRRDLISLIADSIRPDRGSDRAAEPEEAGAVVVLRRPLRVELVVLDRGPEVPEHRLLPACQEGVPDHLVAQRAADPGLRRVADVVEVEEQEGAALAGLQRRPGPAEPVGPKPVEVDPGLVVDPHVARRRDGAAAEVETRDLDPGCLLRTDDAHCGLSPSWGTRPGAGRGNPAPDLVRMG